MSARDSLLLPSSVALSKILAASTCLMYKICINMYLGCVCVCAEDCLVRLAPDFRLVAN